MLENLNWLKKCATPVILPQIRLWLFSHLVGDESLQDGEEPHHHPGPQPGEEDGGLGRAGSEEEVGGPEDGPEDSQDQAPVRHLGI